MKCIDDFSKPIKDNIIKPFKTPSFSECHHDLISAAKTKININKAWNELSKKEKDWIIFGDKHFESFDSSPNKWYGLKGFFTWLEKKAYKTHIRILLSRYRVYERCSTCNGSRLNKKHHHFRLLLDKNHCVSLSYFFDKSIAEIYKDIVLMGTHNDFICESKVFNDLKKRLEFLMALGLEYLTLDRETRTLSGGETQRISIASSVNSSISNLLYIIDEPSTGLHPKNIRSMIESFKCIQENGSSLLIIDNDPYILANSDNIIELGPGGGNQGGFKTFQGNSDQFIQNNKYLFEIENNKQIDSSKKLDFITLRGINKNNIKGMDIEIPLKKFVVVCGLSGSGKTTLIELINKSIKAYLVEKKTKDTEYHSISVPKHINELIYVDQSILHTNRRSNILSYLKIFDIVRKLFVESSMSQIRGYMNGHFSFTSDKGRCSYCKGLGFIEQDMQFLSDSIEFCEFCDGQRFKSEILDVFIVLKNQKFNINDILNLSVKEAINYFEIKKLNNIFQLLTDAGLDYIKLGQPLTYLSTGELQRIKLISSLINIDTYNLKKKIIIFDEPSTGLHKKDYLKIIRLFKGLVEKSCSIIVVEHKIDFINVSDWLVELGPGAGSLGGKVIFNDYKRKLSNCNHSLFKKEIDNFKFSINNNFKIINTKKISLPKKIEIKNLNQNNIKSLSTNVHLNKITCLTGLSGSGKTTFAYDVLFNYGQQSYINSLSTYSQQFFHQQLNVNCELIKNLPPTIAIQQKQNIQSIKSTVGTYSEIYQYLRLLYSKFSETYCYECDVPLNHLNNNDLLNLIFKKYNNLKIKIWSEIIVARKGNHKKVIDILNDQNSAISKIRVDEEIYTAIDDLDLNKNSIHNIDYLICDIKICKKNKNIIEDFINTALKYGNNTFYVETTANTKTYYSSNLSCPNCSKSFSPLNPLMFSFNSSVGWCKSCKGKGYYIETDENDNLTKVYDKTEINNLICEDCEGSRLNSYVENVYYKKKKITEIIQYDFSELYDFFKKIKSDSKLKSAEMEILNFLLYRIKYIIDVGLSYLQISRPTLSLSGGELQRVKLSSELGSYLTGVCFILDEPTIGLHPTDNHKIIKTILDLKRKNNTILIIEHDKDFIQSSDFIMEFGPGAGINGGKVIDLLPSNRFLKNSSSVTAQHLNNKINNTGLVKKKNIKDLKFIEFKNINFRNLKSLNIKFPVNSLTVLTGISGSGKSTLMKNIIKDNLQNKRLIHCDEVKNQNYIEEIIEVDQSQIGKSSRSCIASYIDIFDDIRKIFASQLISKERGFTSSRFSFNNKEGQCSVCNGLGFIKLSMSFLPEVIVGCEDCETKRYNSRTLDVKYKGNTIADILNKTIEEVEPLFINIKKIYSKIQLMNKVGLEYLKLGQSLSSLSGGESQRIKVVTELKKIDKNRSKLYIFDEPSIGLHMNDTRKLLLLINELIQLGGTVILIEHNTDFWVNAEWIIDIGPGGGKFGGTLMGMGPPSIIKKTKSPTGNILKKIMLD